MTSVPDSTREAAAFLGLEATSDPMRWRLPVSFDVCGATGTLHGGCGLGAAVAALELASQRPLAMAASQYLSRAPHGDTCDIELTFHAVGNAMTQAGFRLLDGDRVVLQGHAALGGRDVGVDDRWLEAPSLPGPETCPPRNRSTQDNYSFTDLADVRIASQSPGDRRVRYWSRVRDGLASSTPLLAALGDLLPSGMRVTIDSAFRGSSLDNVIRIAGNDPTEWVLIDLETAAFHNSTGHGVVRIYSQNGALLASGSQSFAVTRLTGPLDR